MAEKKEYSKKDPSQSLVNGPAIEPVDAGAEMQSGVTCRVVGIGASAGGLAAIEKFLAAMAPHTESGLAFVVVQHLDPVHKSILIDLVKRYTRMQAFKVEDGMAVQPNCVYVIPPNRDMSLRHGKLHLREPDAPRGLRLPVDYFFRSLAQDQRERAICIVLSGTGTDGTLGLKAVKGEGGMAMAQTPESAAYDGMPRSAIATGLVDYVLPPDEMPERLVSFVKHAVGLQRRPLTLTVPSGDSLQKVFVLLRKATGHDFSQYKKNTIVRRIQKRMAATQIDSIEDYIRYLQTSPLEVETLFRGVLIGVTNFFREREAFEVIKEKVTANLFAGKPPGGAVRVWVPACATGEEAYSLAILLQEQANSLGQEFQVQIFATDLDAGAIDRARAGVYPESIAADVSRERLAHFFTPEGSSYRIRKVIRDMVVFAKHDIIKDPPFSKMDLISCRNLLIYMEPELQNKVTAMFYNALNQGGYLFLGNSETIGGSVDLFALVDKKWKIYQRRKGAAAPAGFSPPIRPLEGTQTVQRPGGPVKMNIRELAERALLDEYAPACVFINAAYDVLYVHGHTGRYLELPPGDVSVNLLKMARQELRAELTSAVRQVIAQKALVRHNGVRVKANGDTHAVNLVVQPVRKPESARDLIMVIFEEVPQQAPQAAETSEGRAPDEDRRIAELERELKARDDYVQSTIEELETSAEELTSTNEEMQASNEELQSTNEELETSKEELQSVNEELQTVNTELQKKVEELSQVNNDMRNLLAVTGIGTVFLDTALNIQRFTPAATQVINLIPTDVGRPISHIVSRLVGYDRLVQDMREVLGTLIPKEEEVQTSGQWYLMRMQPYRTVENVIEGVVLTFVDITEQKAIRKALQDKEAQLQLLVENMGDVISRMTPDSTTLYVSPSCGRLFGYEPDEMLGVRLLEYIHPDETEKAKHTVQEAIDARKAEFRIECRMRRKAGDYVWVEMVFRLLYGGTGQLAEMQSACRDISARKTL